MTQCSTTSASTGSTPSRKPQSFKTHATRTSQSQHSPHAVFSPLQQAHATYRSAKAPLNLMLMIPRSLASGPSTNAVNSTRWGASPAAAAAASGLPETTVASEFCAVLLVSVQRLTQPVYVPRGGPLKPGEAERDAPRECRDCCCWCCWLVCCCCCCCEGCVCCCCVSCWSLVCCCVGTVCTCCNASCARCCSCSCGCCCIEPLSLGPWSWLYTSGWSNPCCCCSSAPAPAAAAALARCFLLCWPQLVALLMPQSPASSSSPAPLIPDT